jgi:methyltransferase (TIGR00027 family)
VKPLNDSLPSATALLSSAARAAHSLVDSPPHLLVDADARAVCELFEPSPLGFQLAFSGEPVLAAARASAVIRSAFARQIMQGGSLGQWVLLGAGLDTSLHRGASAKLWLVDRPEVLAWRAELFAEAGLADSGVLVGVNLDREDLVTQLVAAGLNTDYPTLVIGLGLSMYLTPAENWRLLTGLGRLPVGSELIFDVLTPDDLADEPGRTYARAVALRAGNAEPWLSRLRPEAVVAGLAEAGWKMVVDTPEAAVPPSQFWTANPQLQAMRLVQLVHAKRVVSR